MNKYMEPIRLHRECDHYRHFQVALDRGLENTDPSPTLVKPRERAYFEVIGDRGLQRT